MPKHCFNINSTFYTLSLKVVYFTWPWNMNLSGKVTRALLSLQLYWILKKKKHILFCLHTCICLLVAYRFIFLMCFVLNNSFMFNFSRTDAHICFTEYVLSKYYVICMVCDDTSNSLQKSVILRYQQNFNNPYFFSGPK